VRLSADACCNSLLISCSLPVLKHCALNELTGRIIQEGPVPGQLKIGHILFLLIVEEMLHYMFSGWSRHRAFWHLVRPLLVSQSSIDLGHPYYDPTYFELPAGAEKLGMLKMDVLEDGHLERDVIEVRGVHEVSYHFCVTSPTHAVTY
jgi:hypothetical protein